MAWISLLLCHLSLAISALAINPSHIKVFPENGAVSGVFLASLQPVQNKNHPYAFNASQAREVCLMLNVIMASRAQVEEAHRNGLETCRYGWVDEQIAVLPRITASKPCGQNRVGVIPWRSVPTRSFDAFCFNSSDIKADTPVSTMTPTTSKPTTIPTTHKQTTIPTTSKPTPTPTVSSPTPAPPYPPTSALPKITQSAPLFPPLHTFPSTLSPPLSSPRSHTPVSSTYLSPSPSYILPLTTSSVASISVPPSPSSTEDMSSSESPLGGTVTPMPIHSDLTGVLPTVLFITIAILSLLATVIAVWYCKTNRGRIVPFWKSGHQKDDIETEVWENLCRKEVSEQHTELELGGVTNESKEIHLEEDSGTHTDAP